MTFTRLFSRRERASLKGIAMSVCDTGRWNDKVTGKKGISRSSQIKRASRHPRIISGRKKTDCQRRFD